MPALPRLRTQRLILRPYAADDLEQFVTLNGDPEVRRHMGGPLGRAEAAQRFERLLSGAEERVLAWALTLASTGRYIGHAFLVRLGEENEFELGFMLNPGAWGQGYGTEAAGALVGYALDRGGSSRVIASVDADHPASIKVLERAGLVQEREVSDHEGSYFIYAKSQTRSPKMSRKKAIEGPLRPRR